MATVSGISLEQFLATHHESPEPDFVDGEVIQRNLPDWTHARLQGRLVNLLNQASGLAVASELRVRLASKSSYIIDVAAYPCDEKLPRFPTTLQSSFHG